MNKYLPLFNYVKERNENELTLNFCEIENILKFPIDHSFLTYKKELLTLGYSVKKISLKNKTVTFTKTQVKV